jgi:hypothetical protein
LLTDVFQTHRCDTKETKQWNTKKIELRPCHRGHLLGGYDAENEKQGYIFPAESARHIGKHMLVRIEQREAEYIQTSVTGR